MPRFAFCCSKRSSRPTTYATINSARTRSMTRQLACHVTDVPPEGLRECELEDGLKVLVANSGDAYYACQATCPHQDVALCEGLYDGAVLTCHQHLWQWDIRS